LNKKKQAHFTKTWNAPPEMISTTSVGTIQRLEKYNRPQKNLLVF
jgi:hypothetical protein